MSFNHIVINIILFLKQIPHECLFFIIFKTPRIKTFKIWYKVRVWKVFHDIFYVTKVSQIVWTSEIQSCRVPMRRLLLSLPHLVWVQTCNLAESHTLQLF